MVDLDRIIDGMNRISLLAQLRDLVYVADTADRNRCGNCVHWMKSRDCPRERNVQGMSRGPSCDDSGCGKFLLRDSARALKLQRVSEALNFAKEHSLPMPQHLQILEVHTARHILPTPKGPAR